MGNMKRSIGRAESVSDYMKIVDDIWVKWTERDDFVSDIWFRGQSKRAWPLIPFAMRKPYSRVSEHRYRHDFRLRALPFLQEATRVPTDSWDWYFLMQHFGIPTRLLDWTESALVALFFAVESSPTADGCVWMLNPRTVNTSLANIGDFIPIYSDPMVAGYLPELWDEDVNHLAEGIIAIDPPLNSPRLAAQRGKFTVHGRGAKSLETYKVLSTSLVSVEVPSSAKGRIARQLMSAGVSHSIMFPGLQGLSREICNLYANDHII